MKNRNKLLSPSQQSRIFKSDSLPAHKNRHFMFLTVLALAGIFLTTMVLATSEPAPTSQSQIVKLPEISTEMHVLGTDPKSNSIPKNIHTQSSSVQPPSVAPEAKIIIDSTFKRPVISDSEAVEREHLRQTLPSDLETKTSLENTIALQEPLTLQEPLNSELVWKEFEINSGDNLSLIFPRAGLNARDVYNVAQTADSKELLNLKPGQIMRLGIDNSQDHLVLRELQLQLNPMTTLQLTANDKGYTAEIAERDLEKRQQIVAGEINNSLFVDGQKAGMSDKLIMQMAHIFGWDIDFALDLRQGDSFKVVYNENYLDGDKIADGEILAAEFTNRGKAFRAIRFTDNEGHSNYFASDGASMRKAFTRTPVPISRISSGFNPNRKHPVLKTNRPHRGVDYAASTGTPILATGDGKVSFIGTKGGYGRTVILSHGGRYTTLFAHMSRYKNGLKTGHRVKQGETIGYIGSSGLATGPHLHYEFRVNGVHKNPLTVALPKAEALPEKYRADFEALAQPLLASLQNIQIPSLALTQE